VEKLTASGIDGPCPSTRGRCEKIKIFRRVEISSTFFKCGRLEGEGNKALQRITIIQVFDCEVLTQKGVAVKLFRYPYPPSQLEAIFLWLQGGWRG
jgi:hypothetical protein